MKTRVVVTSLGVITPNAENLPEFARALKSGKSGISKLQALDISSLRINIAGEIKWNKKVPEMDRFSSLALKTLDQTIKDISFSEKDRSAVIWGTSGGGALSFEEAVRTGVKDEHFTDKISYHHAARLIAEKTHTSEPPLTISTACSSGAIAMGYAFQKIRSGFLDVAVTGGSDTINLSTYAGFHSLRALDPEGCRPFDKERKGLVVGEGAALFVLESLEHAKERGAEILAEIAGAGMSADAFHETSPDPTGSGAALAMSRALEDAGMSPEEIDYINAHGTGTPHNDSMETAAIKKIFGKKAYSIPVSSTKSMIGHLLGAGGPVEAVACIIGMREGFIPPTINYKVPDPECDLDYVPNTSRKANIRTALSNSFAFGGNNATLVMKKYG